MITIDALKQLDRIAQQANALWRQCEALKMQIAEQSGISRLRLEQNGIHVPEAKQESNTDYTA